jgi:hypothetical protein
MNVKCNDLGNIGSLVVCMKKGSIEFASLRFYVFYSSFYIFFTSRMKRVILWSAVVTALSWQAFGERCEKNEKTRNIASMLSQGASDARTLQKKLTPEWACECEDNEMKAYCNVGMPNYGAYLCCIPKGLSCRTKPSETDALPKEKRLSKNAWKFCAEDESFCNGAQVILPSKDTEKFPDGKDPVCGVEGTEAFDVAKKLSIPLRPCAGSFFDRCECEEGEKKIMRPALEVNGRKYLQPDCEAEEKSEDSGENDNVQTEAKNELKLEKKEEEEEEKESGESKTSLRSNRAKKKTEKDQDPDHPASVPL